MKKLLFVIFILSVSIINCKPESENGIYIVYDIKPDDARFNRTEHQPMDSISVALGHKMRNKKYKLTYQKEFVILKDEANNEEIILAKKDENNDSYYTASVKKYHEELDIYLFEDDKDKSIKVLLIEFSAHPDKLIHPTQLGGYVTLWPYGRAVCYLSKLNVD